MKRSLNPPSEDMSQGRSDEASMNLPECYRAQRLVDLSLWLREWGRWQVRKTEYDAA
jgi:hypothetical protein